MKKVTIKFIGVGIGNKYQANVSLYDECSNIIYQGKTCNGKLVVCLNKNKIYRLSASSYGKFINTVFYVSNENEYTFVFNIYNTNTNLRTITFNLKDANYTNLPIEKGEIILWQKP